MIKKSFAGALCALTLAFSAALPANAAVTVVVNGNTMNFDQPPVERAGRVFVPLRGIFESLGASVVYANGVINATGNGRNISLRIGSQQATVNGQSQTIDVAPFLIGSRTLVPLRFIAQSLGASVDWNGSNQTVTINGNGGTYTSPPHPTATQPPSNASFFLTDKRPATSATTLHPAIHAHFSEPVQRDTMHVLVDGTDVTSDVYANANGFDVTPTFTLNPGSHHVDVTGTTQAGANFKTGWTFTTSNGVAENFLNNIAPTNGSAVQSTFTLTGKTLPNSRIHVVESGAASAFGGLLQIGTGTFQGDVTADANGNFGINIPTGAPGGAQIRVVLQSLSPGGASIERSLTYHT